MAFIFEQLYKNIYCWTDIFVWCCSISGPSEGHADYYVCSCLSISFCYQSKHLGCWRSRADRH